MVIFVILAIKMFSFSDARKNNFFVTSLLRISPNMRIQGFKTDNKLPADINQGLRYKQRVSIIVLFIIDLIAPVLRLKRSRRRTKKRRGWLVCRCISMRAFLFMFSFILTFGTFQNLSFWTRPAGRWTAGPM